MPIEKTANMASNLAFIFGSFLFALCTAGSSVLAEIGCPPAETITPCICDDSTTTRLVCSSIMAASVLERVFKNSERYTFQEVHLESVVIQYLPSEIFTKARINELYIKNSKFISLLYEPPTVKTLEKLQLDNTTIMRGFLQSDNLKGFTGLKTLIVSGMNGIKTLSSTFSKQLPSSLKEIILHRTGIKKIMPDAFSSLPNLDKLEVSSSKLSALTRNMFPSPFNVRFLYFDNNNISRIPEDLFIYMPELQFLTMRNNYITEIPEPAFGKRRVPIPYMRFEGNPLQCNCLLVWLVKNKPEVFGGTCQTPSNLRGKRLQDLLPGDFNC